VQERSSGRLVQAGEGGWGGGGDNVGGPILNEEDRRLERFVRVWLFSPTFSVSLVLHTE
jgi:hypothetical protein